MTLSRRDFLETAAGVAWIAPATQRPEWFDRPMRWAQLTLVENDPGRYDPGFWLDYFRRTHSDAACLSAGGCVAYYPTKIPLHYRTPWMGATDPFGELLAGCRKLGMVVLARTDPHAAHQDLCDAHPDWIAVDAQGRKRRHWASPDLWVTCALGPYNFDFMTQVTREIVSLYQVDGIFSNRWAGSGMCYCEHCAASFRAACQMDLPRTNDPRDPARRNYILWREQRLFELWRLWDAAIRQINPHARFIANAGGGALSGLDMKTLGELAPTLVRRPPGAARADAAVGQRQERQGIPRHPGAQSHRRHLQRRASRSRIAGRIPSRLAAEIRVWVADGIANGLRPWFTKFSGTLYDRRWLKVVEDIYDWHYRAERYLRNEAPLARVAMVYSQQTATFYGGEHAAQKVEDHTLGMYHALVEARIPFEMVHDRLLDAAHVDRFKLLILPNIAALSDAQCAAASRVRGARRQPARHLRDLALRRMGRAARRLRPGRRFRRRLRRPPRRADAELLPAPREGPRHRPASPAPGGPGGCRAHHQRRVARRCGPARELPQPAAHADPLVSRPAHGGGLPARPENRYSRGLPA